VEGRDDVAVYDIWIKLAVGTFVWEPLVAHGKEGVLAFRDLLLRDKMKLLPCTFFIIDHDYDGTRNRVVDDRVFVLPAYSIENYLVTERVLEAFLKISLEVHGGVLARRRALEKFEELRCQFSKLIEPCCAKLFGAKLYPVGNIIISDSLDRYFDIGIEGVCLRNGVCLEDIVRTDVPLPAAAYSCWSSFIAGRDMYTWIRGKFLLYFFRRVCKAFFHDLCSERPRLFGEQRRGLKYSVANDELATLAAWSAIPVGFGDVVKSWLASCRLECGKRAEVVKSSVWRGAQAGRVPRQLGYFGHPQNSS
jgi:hypothetical protein